MPADDDSLAVRKQFDQRIAVLKLFPGITPAVVRSILHTPDLRGVVMETYGSGNAPTENWFLDTLQEAIDNGIIVMDVTQCKTGAVQLKQYAAGSGLEERGVISGHDITVEAAVTKMMYLLGNYGDDLAMVRHYLATSIRGEMSI